MSSQRTRAALRKGPRVPRGFGGAQLGSVGHQELLALRPEAGPAVAPLRRNLSPLRTAPPPADVRAANLGWTGFARLCFAGLHEVP